MKSLTGQRLRLNRRRVLAVAAFAGLATVVLTTAVVEVPVLTAAVPGLVGMMTLAAVLVLWWQVSRVGQQNQQLSRQVRALRAPGTGVVDRVERIQRRVLAALEADRLAAADRERRAQRALERSRHAQVREMEALLQLFRDFAPRAPMPSSGGWALNPTDLLALLHLVGQRQPKTVVELGSGTSSVWLAYAVERGGGRLVTLENDPRFVERTRTLLDSHGLAEFAEVRLAQLRPTTLDDREYLWYDVEALADVTDIDLLLVDGPVGRTCPQARYPALRVLEPMLSSTATIVLDDADREEEQEIARRWTADVSGLAREPELLGRHAVFRYSRLG